jgi:hypothetical protein
MYACSGGCCALHAGVGCLACCSMRQPDCQARVCLSRHVSLHFVLLWQQHATSPVLAVGWESARKLHYTSAAVASMCAACQGWLFGPNTYTHTSSVLARRCSGALSTVVRLCTFQQRDTCVCCVHAVACNSSASANPQFSCVST